MLVAVRANQPRNETGVLLQEGVCYSARFVASAGWRDGRTMVPPPEGFDFATDVLGLDHFWWMRWLRPRLQEAWFEVVGRIDRQPRVSRF